MWKIDANSSCDWDASNRWRRNGIEKVFSCFHRYCDDDDDDDEKSMPIWLICIRCECAVRTATLFHTTGMACARTSCELYKHQPETHFTRNEEKVFGCKLKWRKKDKIGFMYWCKCLRSAWSVVLVWMTVYAATESIGFGQKTITRNVSAEETCREWCTEWTGKLRQKVNCRSEIERNTGCARSKTRHIRKIYWIWKTFRIILMLPAMFLVSHYFHLQLFYCRINMWLRDSGRWNNLFSM